MSKKSANIKAVMQPSSSVIVSCRGRDGKDNALVVAYCCNCSYDPPMAMVGIVPSRYSYQLVKDTGCFVVNIPAKANKALFNYMGSHSGREEDKLKAFGAKISNGLKVNAPVLEDCPVSIECTVVDSIRTGSHEMFAGKIEHIHVDEQFLKEDGAINFAAIELL